MRQARQGDLLFVRVDSIPEHREGRRVSPILALGESTGHAHVVEDGTVRSVEYEGLFVESTGKARVVHPEHETVELPEGTYRVIRQRQFGDGGWSNVGD